MKEKLLNLLACPDCSGDILLKNVRKKASIEILEAELSCADCETVYPVTRGVPRFAKLEDVESDKKETAENFGWQWNKFTQEDSRYEEQLLGWLQPVEPAYFKDKIVVEGGCGKGRHTLLADKWGAKEIVGIDLSSAVESAFDATQNKENCHIIQADIFNLPLKKAFDFAFSVGVLHHTPDPEGAFLSLASKVKEGGAISAWIYGRENNDWIVNFVNPVREKITSRMSQPALYHVSKLPTLPLFMASKLVYRPMNSASKSVADKLFYNEYINHLASFGWREQHNIVFDHLVAPTAFYISRSEFENWWTKLGISNAKITWHNENSWCGFGEL